MATATKRHPGRRTPAEPKAVERHLKSILQAETKRRKLEDDADTAMTTLAERIDKAMQAGVPTNEIAKTLGNSRQMVYKLVRERVDGKPLSKGNNPFSKNGSKKKKGVRK